MVPCVSFGFLPNTASTSKYSHNTTYCGVRVNRIM